VETISNRLDAVIARAQSFESESLIALGDRAIEQVASMYGQIASPVARAAFALRIIRRLHDVERGKLVSR
jgi:hypothetical protein